MKMFATLAGVLWMAGLALGLWIDAPFTTGARFTGAVLLVFAWLGRWAALREEADQGSIPRPAHPAAGG